MKIMIGLKLKQQIKNKQSGRVNVGIFTILLNMILIYSLKYGKLKIIF